MTVKKVKKDDQHRGPLFQFTSLTQEQRRSIVNRTSNYSDPAAKPAQANQFMLTALGASLDLDGEWAVSDADNLAQWRQITNQGRDHYVRVVRRGYLFPVGHRAVLVDVIERVFVYDPNMKITAYLQKKSFIRVTQPLKTYPAFGQPFDGRSWPFTSVLIATEVSPILAPEPIQKLRSNDEQAGFPQSLEGGDVLWTLVATDGGGNETTLSVPLVFVYGREDPGKPGFPGDVGYAQELADTYNRLDDRRTGDTGGSRIRFAPEVAGHPGATTHPTVQLTLAAATIKKDPNSDQVLEQVPTRVELAERDQPAFYPSVGAARPRLPAAEALTKKTTDLSIRPYHGYVEQGLSANGEPQAQANTGAVYAEAVDPEPLEFAGEAVGAVATPNFAVTGLSASAGPIGGSVDAYAGTAQVQAADYFAGLEEALAGELLGGLKLADIIGTMPAPTIVALVDQVARVQTVRYHLEAPVREFEGFKPLPGTMLTLETVVTTDLSSGNATYSVEGHIGPFLMEILGGGGPLHFIDIPFDNLRFTSKDGAKPDVDVDVGKVQFQEVLRFVNALAAFLEGMGAGGGPAAAAASASDQAAPSAAAAAASGEGSGLTVNVSSTAVDAGASLALPAITVGVFNMQNLALNAGVHLPFTGAPAVARFAFSSREHPFMLTVMAFGGGGFIGLNVGLKQVELVEASLEFGAQIALNLGVASGGVTVAGGVYFKFENDKGLELTGFVRVTGALEVLGLIAISAEFNLALTYKPKPSAGERSSLAGTATLRVEIDLAFFSVSKDLTVSQEFAGADPSFQQMVPSHATWRTYCNAFAA